MYFFASFIVHFFFFQLCIYMLLSSSQDDYVEALGRLHLTVSRAYRVNPEINFEVFIHKVDGLSDDHKIETQRDIHQRANDDLADASLEKLHLRYIILPLHLYRAEEVIICSLLSVQSQRMLVQRASDASLTSWRTGSNISFSLYMHF